MSKYDEIPKSNPDFSKPPLDIAKHYQDSYFAVRSFCSGQIFRAEMWKLAAVTGWSVAGLGLFTLGLKTWIG